MYVYHLVYYNNIFFKLGLVSYSGNDCRIHGDTFLIGAIVIRVEVPRDN